MGRVTQADVAVASQAQVVDRDRISRVNGFHVQTPNQRPTEDEVLQLMKGYRLVFDFFRTMVSAIEAEGIPGVPTPFQRQMDDGLMQLHRAEKYFLYQTLKALADDERWKPLADRPLEFERGLMHILDSVRSFMRVKYRIESNRPTKMALRDARIAVLRDQGLPFPEIAKRLGMGGGNVHLAYERHEERAYRCGEALRNIVNFCEAYPGLAEPIVEPPEAFA